MRNGYQASYLFATSTYGDGATLYWLANSRADQGMFGCNGAASWDLVADGLNNSIAVGEASRSDVNVVPGAYWGAGVQGCCHGTVKPMVFSSHHAQGAHFLFGDGTVRFLSDAMDSSLLYALHTIHGGDATAGTL